MKTLPNLLLMVALMAALFTAPSCSKEGPAGPAGEDGINGTNGNNGQDGNANVSLFLFETGNTFNSPVYNKSYSLTGITNNMVDSSLVLVYATDEADSWFQIGSTNTARAYSTKWYYIKGFGGAPTGEFYIDIESPSGAAEFVNAPVGQALSLGKVKFIIAPTNVFVGKREMDFTNYEETMLSLGLNP